MAERREPAQPLIKPCAVKGCTNDASWGFGVNLIRDRIGTWFCAQHRHLGNPATQARAPPGPPAPPPKDPSFL